MANFTKKAIMTEFMQILEEKSLDKITVKDICERCEINRNTFYYYFKDVYDVLDTIFELEKELVFQTVNNDNSFFEGFKRSASIIVNNKNAINHIFQSKKRDIIQEHFGIVINELVSQAVKKAIIGYSLTEEDIYFITNFYSSAIFGSTIKWIEKGMPPYKDDLITRIAFSFDATIDDLIKMSIK